MLEVVYGFRTGVGLFVAVYDRGFEFPAESACFVRAGIVYEASDCSRDWRKYRAD